MEPRRSKRIKISKEGDFGVLLGALMRELPDVFKTEVLSKLNFEDHAKLLFVNKECKDFVCNLPPIDFMRTLSKKWPPDSRLQSIQDPYDDECLLSVIATKAAQEGRLDVLKLIWLHDSGRNDSGDGYESDVFSDVFHAASHGQKHVLDWYAMIPHEGLDARVAAYLETLDGACDGAAWGGHLELLKYLREKGCAWSEETCVTAANGAHLHVLKWLRECGCPWYLDIMCAAAAGSGNLEIMQWVHDNGCPWNNYTCACAAAAGHLEILKWLRENGCPWDDVTCRYAATHGHLEVLKWARGNECPWNDETCDSAAKHGQLETLKWSHENGCPWSEIAWKRAAAYGRWECLQYLVDNKCPGSENLSKIYGRFVRVRVPLK